MKHALRYGEVLKILPAAFGGGMMAVEREGTSQLSLSSASAGSPRHLNHDHSLSLPSSIMSRLAPLVIDNGKQLLSSQG